MKIPAEWLREWVDLPGTPVDWADKLTRGGVEAQATPLLPALPTGVVVGHIREVQPHPNSERLSVCTVDAGEHGVVSVVCGAPNAAVGLRAPLALPGARLPNGQCVDTVELRGVPSQGMLCSAAELGLDDSSEGLLELGADLCSGAQVTAVLRLDDWIVELELTPNRGDCASVLGLARELAALYDRPLMGPAAVPATVTANDRVDVRIDDPQGCTRYVGQGLVGLRPNAASPWWLCERLRRCGLRAIHPVVDVTNYVMLELGQPLHAFDVARLTPPIIVRRAADGETIQLLNGQAVSLVADDLLIAQERPRPRRKPIPEPLALAGVMGGSGSAVDAATQAVFLESACFDPVRVAASGRRHNITSDARYRFERGVDPELQRRALERATALILEICGGHAGPVVDQSGQPRETPAVRLRRREVERLLGTSIPDDQIEALLARLGIQARTEGPGLWRAEVPSHRYDLRIEADLVEEVGRLWGYERIAPRAYPPEMPAIEVPESRRDPDTFCQRLAAHGYHEVVSYSFIQPQWCEWLAPGVPTITVDNPIAETMSAMRPALWPGLLDAWRHNRQRQMPRARLFELGGVFERGADDTPTERLKLGVLLAGTAFPEQWGQTRRGVDLFDLKADVEASLAPLPTSWRWRSEPHPALHPGRSARLYVAGTPSGWLGELHPQLAERLDVGPGVQLLELDWEAVSAVPIAHPVPPPEQPATRRDLALVVDETVPAQALVDTAGDTGIDFLRRVFVFDAWHGGELEVGRKSVALGLIFQHPSRTLTDEEVATAVAAVAERLARLHGAGLRTS